MFSHIEQLLVINDITDLFNRTALMKKNHEFLQILKYTNRKILNEITEIKYIEVIKVIRFINKFYTQILIRSSKFSLVNCNLT